MNGDYEPVAAPATKTAAVSDEQVAETRKQHPLSDGALRSIVANEFGVNDPGLCAELAAELLSRRAANTAVGVEVKALVWTGDFNNTAYADSQFGKFAAWIINGSAYVRAPWFQAGGIPCGSTADDAKARALELIWEYVSPALTCPASPVSAEVTEAAAELIRRVRAVLDELGPGGYLVPAGASKTNYLEAACNALTAALSTQGQEAE